MFSPLVTSANLCEHMLLQMLTLPDWTLFYWAIGKKEIPADSEWKNSKVLGMGVASPTPSATRGTDAPYYFQPN